MPNLGESHRRAAALVASAVLASLTPATALAADAAIVFEPSVAQYRQAVSGVKAELSGAIDVDPDQPGAESKLADAPVIVAVGRKSLAFAHAHAGNHPVVFCMVLGVSNADLNKTTTGVPLEPDANAVLDNLKDLSSTFTRIGFVYNPKTSEVLEQEAERAAKSHGMVLLTTPVSNGDDLKNAVQKLTGVNALWLPPDPKLFTKEIFSFLLGLSAERHIPLIGFLDSLTQAGALASISPNYVDNGTRAGKLAADILAKPESRRTPVPPPVFAPGNLTINLQTAQALGIQISEKAIAAAKQVVR